MISRNGAAKVGFGGGTVSLEGGPEVKIPAGAIAGGAQDASVTISTSTQTMSLPAGFMKAVGDVYDIRPAGTTFAEPVLITLPIPNGTDPQDVLGLATVDPDTGKWVGVSSTVDTNARTVSAFTTPLSLGDDRRAQRSRQDRGLDQPWSMSPMGRMCTTPRSSWTRTTTMASS